jgi:hypothetical protein
MAVFALSLLLSVLGTKKSANGQADDYRLTSSVESVAMLAAERLWSGYLEEGAGTAGTIWEFRNFLTALGIADQAGEGIPKLDAGTDLLPLVALPELEGEAQFQDVTVEALRIVRRDVGDATQLYLTVSARTNRGGGLANPAMNRAVQQVYTVEPAPFEGFDYALLANNVNCVFCHANVDSVDRFYNDDPAKLGTFDRVKVGSLETLMLRHTKGAGGSIHDWDADSFIAGTLYVRGTATDHNGNPISNWPDLAFQGYEFSSLDGALLEGTYGMLPTPFVEAAKPFQPFENLYLDYPTQYAQMVDGGLPVGFPAPIPDDGGVDPVTGLPDATGAGNKVVDDFEFDAAVENATGKITAGVINVVPNGEVLDDALKYAEAVLYGNEESVQAVVDGNLVLTGTKDNPITIAGTVAVDGDLIINGYVKGEGTLIVRGNVYVPTDLEYLDGVTFGVDPDGGKNALGLAAGGNILIGDYLAPSILQPDLTKKAPLKYEIVDGDFDPSVLAEDNGWNFSLAEISLFNRAEWAKTQEYLPAEDGGYVANPYYVDDYVPRYYNFGEGDAVPIYNKGDLYWDPETLAWHGDAEVPLYWDESLLTIADPMNPNDPVLYPGGEADPVLYQLTPSAAWLPDDLYKASLEYYEDIRPLGKPITLDGLFYTNNAIFSIVNRAPPMFGRMEVNGSLIAADIGMLAPGIYDPYNVLGNQSPLSKYAIGLQLNYDKRLKEMLNVKNPMQVQLKRTLWNPTANVQ